MKMNNNAPTKYVDVVTNIKTYFPSLNEMKDLPKYIEDVIEKDKGHKYGIAKVINEENFTSKKLHFSGIFPFIVFLVSSQFRLFHHQSHFNIKIVDLKWFLQLIVKQTD